MSVIIPVFFPSSILLNAGKTGIRAGLFLSLIGGCNTFPESDDPLKVPALSCPHAEDVQDSGPDNPIYRVVTPNGGESFRKGGTLAIKVRSEELGEADLKIIIGAHSFPLPGAEGSFNPQEDSLHALTIPEHFLVIHPNEADPSRYDTTYIDAASDSCLIQIHDYSVREFQDYSDCYFSIGE